MSLYFKERIEEQKEDPKNDKIVFNFPWIIEIPSPNEDNVDGNDDNVGQFRKTMMTSYNYSPINWNLDLNLTRDYFNISLSGLLVCKAVCNVSFTLFYDNDMRFELHSSTKTKLLPDKEDDSFRTPDGFLQKIVNEYVKRKIKKIVIYLELIVPMKNFCRPFDLESHRLEKLCIRYPEDLENDFKFAFLKNGDYTIKCSDGSVPASRVLLYATSRYMREHLDKSEDVEFIVACHSIDVVKPIVYYLHSRFLQMPKTYDFDFVDRLYAAVDFFRPVEKDDISNAIYLSVCLKFTEEDVDFDGVLRWIKFSYRHKFGDVWIMICTLVAHKYYFKWQQTFPPHARNSGNPLYRDIFGPDCDLSSHRFRINNIFDLIESAFASSLFTNVILD